MENVYNEFKRNNISVPYNQLEVRNRTDKVKMPFTKEALPKRVEKVRDEKASFDLETASLSDIMHMKKSKKKKEEVKETAPEETKVEVKEEVVADEKPAKKSSKKADK